MKQILQLIECNVDFPDDTVWDETEEQIVQTGGQSMAWAVADLLRANGARVSNPADHIEHGWELDAFWQDGTFFLQVTQLLDDEAIIITRDNTLGIFARLIGTPSPYTAFLEMLHRVLSLDSRFSNIRWQPWNIKPGIPGALSPTSHYPGPA